MSDSKSSQQEPSMEDILSSIRRIISEDGTEKPEEEAAADPAPETEPVPEAEEAESEDVFDLTDMVDDEGNVVELSEDAEGVPEALEDGEDEEDDTLIEGTEETVPEGLEEADDDGAVESLMSDDTEAEATDALSELAKVTAPGPADDSALRVVASGLTIEEYVLEMLRPMLREWLDKNLPTLVQRLVEREIEKLVRRANPLD